MSLRYVIFGGEALSLESLRPWWERFGDQQPTLVNMYGITETTVHVTYRRLRMQDLAPGSSMIGGPIDDLQMYLLDENGEPVPLGVTGELYVGGAGLARGYWNRTELTAERFVPDAFSQRAGARLYRTGDLARRRADGEVEYLGRIDHQVKIRGFRIELGEIEAALAACEGVRETVVLANNEKGDTRLAAYVGADDTVTASALRQQLQQRLPDYMVPASILVLDRLPLTPNGKIDRKALPAIDGTPELATAYQAPRNPVEEMLSNIWAQVLGVERVGVDDNFFELGGDSILSLRIVARAKASGLDFSTRQLFEHPSVQALAPLAEPVASSSTSLTFAGPAPLTPIQHWFFQQQLDQPQHWNQALMLASDQRVDPVALESAVRHVFARHNAFSLRFQSSPEGWLQSAQPDSPNWSLEHLDLRSVAEPDLTAAIEQAATQAQSSLHLENGPLARVLLLHLGPHGFRLLFVIHHLIIDGVSWRILIEDVIAAYAQLRGGEPIALAPVSLPFGFWSQRLWQYAGSAEVQSALAYSTSPQWSHIPPIPVDHPQACNCEGNTEVVVKRWDRQQTLELLQEAPRAYHTHINDILLTALAQALGLWSGAHRFLIHLEGHGREDLIPDTDLSRTLGWFTTLFPTLLQWHPDLASGEPAEAGERTAARHSSARFELRPASLRQRPGNQNSSG